MEAIEAIKKRRSCREFAGDAVNSNVIEELVECGRLAPSGRGEQPWEFVVVTDSSLRERIAALASYGRFIGQAPVCIAVFCKATTYYLEDGAAATENILLAANGLGLGSVWCGVYPVPERVAEARSILGIPEEVVPFCYIAIGDPAEEKPPRTQYDDARVHEERW